MSALSVVWAARERLLRLESPDDDGCRKLMGRLDDVMNKGEIDIKNAYDLDDEVEHYYLLQKGIANEMSSEQEGEHQLGNFIRNGVNRVHDGAKNFKDRLTNKGKGQSEVSTQDVGIKHDVISNPADEQATSVEGTLNKPAHTGKAKWDSKKILAFVHLNPRGKQASNDSKSEGDPCTDYVPTSDPGASQTSSVAATDFLSDVSIPKEIFVGKTNVYFDKAESILLESKVKKFIWICGTKNGVGKTTLARRLFDKSSKLLQHFNGRAWVTVGTKFQAREVAGLVLFQLSYAAIREKDIEPMATTEVMERLEEAQRGRRCLLVLDDVPTVEAWKTIQSALQLHRDTRVIITACLTQTDSEKFDKISNYEVIRKDLFMIEPTWELLENQLSKEDQSVAKDENWKESIEILKKNIYRRCEGIPLATTVLGAMMRGKLETLLSGQKGELLDWLNTSSPEGENLQELLSLCYKMLPYLLKSCFLYLGLFPDYRVIPVEKLYLMWITEGIILEREGETRMLTAEKYLKALAQRGLVLLQEEDSTPSLLKVKSCQLHPLVYKLCISEGQKDGFIRVEESKGDQERLQTKCKMAIYEERLLHSVLKNDEAKHIRALLFFRRKGYVGETADFKDFELAKVLDFDGVDFPSRKIPKSIDKLVHLRHLSFRGCNLEQLPSSFSKLKFLETLDLFVKRSGAVIIIPSDLGELTSLLHLYLPLNFKTPETNGKLKLNQLTKLETLENFHAGKCDVGDLQFLKNLRIFKGFADGDKDEVNGVVEFIHKSKYLCSSALCLKYFDIEDTDKSLTVKKLLSTKSLLGLEIEGYFGNIPAVTYENVNITKIVFDGSEFDENPMLILGCFRHLRDLVLSNDAYLGSKLNCAKGSFPKLRFLTLSNMWSLEKLMFESGALACLASLIVEHCRKFKISRSILKRLPTLREVMIDVEIRD